ncbi:MAG: hypothetical protein ACE5GX_07100 [Thermoanaerobaculia bacterium]
MVARRCHRPRTQAGYNLVALMVAVAVVNIGIAAVLPLWSKAIQRQKESELIFRGLQYAEAIRVFQVRTGRFPTRLEELIEIEPRAIRQLWLDPMNEEPEWGLVLAQAAQAPTPQGQQITQGSAPERRERRRRSRRERRLQREVRRTGRDDGATVTPRQRIESPGGGRRGIPRAGQMVTQGPIIGVHSLSEEVGSKTFEGGSKYSDWKFTTELLPQIQLGATGENIPRLHSNWIGKPFPEGAEGGLEGGLPGSPLDDDREGRRPNRRRNRRSDPDRD